MKKTRLLLGTALLAAVITLVPGCATAPKGDTGGGGIISTNTADKLAPVLTSSVAGAVVYAYIRDTNCVNIIDAIRVTLNEFFLSDDLSGLALQTRLYGLNIAELKTPEAALIMAPLIGVYKAFADQQVKAGVKKNAALETMVKALVDGLDQGLLAIANIDPKAPPSRPHPATSDRILQLQDSSMVPPAEIPIYSLTDMQALDTVIYAMTRDVQIRTKYLSRR